MLIRHPRQTARDIEQWNTAERVDAAVSARTDWAAVTRVALDEMESFARAGPCYVSVSWGKDSTVIAHFAERLRAERGMSLPVVWVRREPIDNPDCYLVRDAMRAIAPCLDMHEVRVDCAREGSRWWAVGVADRTQAARPKHVGFARAAMLVGSDRYVSGVRAAESGARSLRMMRHGMSTDRTCAPIGWWPTERVYAYLHAHGLPVHPAYACTQGGIWERDRIRVGSLGGRHGRGHGRAEWEATYYREEVGAIRRAAGAAPATQR